MHQEKCESKKLLKKGVGEVRCGWYAYDCFPSIVLLPKCKGMYILTHLTMTVEMVLMPAVMRVPLESYLGFWSNSLDLVHTAASFLSYRAR